MPEEITVSIPDSLDKYLDVNKKKINLLKIIHIKNSPTKHPTV